MPTPVLSLPASAASEVDQVLTSFGSSADGLSSAEAAGRLQSWGPNAVRSHHVSPGAIALRQVRSPILILLAATAAASFALGDTVNASIIGLILSVSVSIGFVNEYRSERCAEALHESIRHRVVVLRDGEPVEVDVADLVPGDVVRLHLGQIVPADLRLLSAVELECDESVLTGESTPASKATTPVGAENELADLTSCALMGSIVRSGTGSGVVIATGGRAAFGAIALGLGERQPETAFQIGLRGFSRLLLEIGTALTVTVLVTNLALGRGVLQSLLFALAIAVGVTPQLLPAVVATCLASGARRLSRRSILVKRMVSIEDLGDLDLLLTDKTGTLTEGRVGFDAGLDEHGSPSPGPVRLGVLATDQDPTDPTASAEAGNELDRVLWSTLSEADRLALPVRRLALDPFDHKTRYTRVVVADPDGGRRLIVKGAAESVMALCAEVPANAQATLDQLYGRGSRVIAVAEASLASDADPDRALADPAVRPAFAGFLTFVDAPKVSARDALTRLAGLGVTVKIVTGDSAAVAEHVCATLGLPPTGTLTGHRIDELDDGALREAAVRASIFARVSPEQKARIVTVLRETGRAVGFLGDGVNDALALHAADVGISVDTATDVAKDAADVILLEKDLDVIAEGVLEGRTIFANTMKYVLMGTSSNLGNMFSAAAASAVLPFLPILPGQILLNNVLYDTGQLSIPTDRVDEESTVAPAHWDLGLIRRFTWVFGPVSSLFDFATFAVLLGLLHAAPHEFRTGWFVESLTTQVLVIFVIRTRRVPFLRSRPGVLLAISSVAVVLLGFVIPLSPFGSRLGFTVLPGTFYLALAGLAATYLVLVDLVKRLFYGGLPQVVERSRGQAHLVHRRAARFSVGRPPHRPR